MKVDLRVKFSDHVRFVTCSLDMRIIDLRKKLKEETGMKFTEIKYQNTTKNSEEIEPKGKEIVSEHILRGPKTLRFYGLHDNDTLILVTDDSPKVLFCSNSLPFFANLCNCVCSIRLTSLNLTRIKKIF